MAGEGDAERLVVLLEARIRDFEKNMAKASGTATKSYSGMRRGSQTATQRMERDMLTSTARINQALAATGARMGRFTRGSLGSLALGATAALAPILSVGAALRTAQAALTEFDQIGKRAKSSGLDAETFQEYAYAADLAGVSTDSLSSALDAFNRNAGRAAAGKGELVENLRVLNPELLESIQLARTQEERFRLVADAIRDETDASTQAAIAAAAFGDAGVKMVEMLRDGAAGLDQTAAKARNLGIVIDSHLISRAEAMNDEFTTATKVLDLQFKQALINLAPFLTSTAQLAAQLAGVIRDIGDSIQYMSGNLEAISNDNLANRARTIGVEEVRLQSLINELTKQGTHEANQARIDALEYERQQLLAESANIETILANRRNTAPDRPEITDPSDIQIPGAGGRNAVADAALKQGEAVKALIADLKHEQEQLGRNADEQELYNLLKGVGVERQSEFGQQIEASLGPLQAQREAMERNAEVMAALGDIGRSAIDGIIDALDDGKITAEEFGDILGDVLKMAGSFFLNSAFTSLGSAFSGPSGGAGGVFTNLEIRRAS